MTAPVSSSSGAKNAKPSWMDQFQQLDPEQMLDLLQSQYSEIDRRKEAADAAAASSVGGTTSSGPSATSGTTEAQASTAAPDTRTASSARQVNNDTVNGLSRATMDARNNAPATTNVKRGITGVSETST
jgi:hypothetical protein